LEKTVLQLLKDIIEIPSVFPKEKKLAEYCSEFLKNKGFDVNLIPIEKNRFNVIAIKGNQEKSVLLFGHLDTVPPYSYKKNPFKMDVKGDIISGLGSWDMKAGLAIILSSVSKINPKNMGLKIAFSVDEENISLGSNMIFTEEFLKNIVLGITPEIMDPVKNFEYKNFVLLGRRGRIVYKLDIHGIAGHGAALKGVSAISLASKIVEYIENYKFNSHDFLGNTTIFIREIKGSSTSLSIPELCTLYLDVHYIPPYTTKILLNEIKKSIEEKFSDYFSKGAKISIEIAHRDTPYLEPYITDKNNFYVKKVIRLLSKKMDGLIISAGLTVADENVVANKNVPVITLGPIGGDSHSSKEWVSKKSIEKLERIYVGIIESLIDSK